ncbi:MAG: NfeD family protein [Acidobacteria bacterium]|nr:NfeD family protein [Acidobacteriota bacterium]
MPRPTKRRSPFWRYTVFQVPGWIVAAAAGWWLVTSLDAPEWVAVGLPAAWFVKDMALYPLVRTAYEIDDTPPIARLVGRVGTAAQRLAPRGYVRVRGELWRAETDAGTAVEPEAAVEVVGAAGLTLRVRPRAAADPSVE